MNGCADVALFEKHLVWIEFRCAHSPKLFFAHLSYWIGVLFPYRIVVANNEARSIEHNAVNIDFVNIVGWTDCWRVCPEGGEQKATVTHFPSHNSLFISYPLIAEQFSFI